MSIKGFAQAFLWCIAYIIFLLFWQAFQMSHISTEVYDEYNGLPQYCGGYKSGHYPCNLDIDKLNATDNEKFWLKLSGWNILIVTALFGLSLVVGFGLLNFSGSKKHLSYQEPIPYKPLSSKEIELYQNLK